MKILKFCVASALKFRGPIHEEGHEIQPLIDVDKESSEKEEEVKIDVDECKQQDNLYKFRFLLVTVPEPKST